MKFAVLLTTALAASLFASDGGGTAQPPAYSNCQGREDCRKECDNGQLAACLRWGDQLMDGIGGPADPDTALRIWDRACNRGLEAACRVSAIHRLGQPNESASAARALGIACDHGDAAACEFVARSRPVPTDPAELERNDREDCVRKEDRDACRAVLCADARRVGLEKALGGLIVETHRAEAKAFEGDFDFEEYYKMHFISEGCRLGERSACEFNEHLVEEACRAAEGARGSVDSSSAGSAEEWMESLALRAFEECRQGKVRACMIYDTLASKR